VIEAEDRMGSVYVNGEEKRYKRGMLQSEYTPWLKNMLKNDRLMYTGLSDYMNDKTVRAALHIPDTTPAWEECSDKVGTAYQLQQEASFWIYDVLRVNGIKMLFYSGETDGAVPTSGSKKWIKDYGWDITTPWAPWMSQDGQVNGWSTTYAKIFTFTIVKGVGHMAPQWSRQACLDMVNSFIY
jgi:carboxypeptidase C (cathepsin A)